MRALPHPPRAEKDLDSVEVLRGWIVEGELEVAIAPWVWQDQTEEWGRLLADAAGHMADAIASETGRDRAEVYRTIVDSVRHYLKHPSPDRQGDFVGDDSSQEA